MKKNLLAASLFIAVISVGINGYSQHAFLDQPLIEALDQAQSNELISVVLMLENKVDVASLKTSFDSNKTPAKRRAPLLETALKTKASSTQPAILDFIESSDLAHSEIQTFWIANSIAVKAEPQLVMALADRDDISHIYLNRKSFGYMPKPEKAQGGAKIEGGIEPGLEAIGAPEMWAMGYTGHGRIALTYDTGVWDDHPSHKDRFLANRMPLGATWFGYDSPVPVDKSSSHGTHVTGIMLGLDKTTSDTIGVAPEAYYIATDPVVSNLAFVKPLTDFMFAYQWSIDPDGDPETTSDIPDVINNSWGFGPDLDEAPCPDFVIPVFEAVEAAGIANVSSAGNEGPGDMTMSVPHNTNIGLVNSFTVGATSTADPYPIASFSSRGPSVCDAEGGSLMIKPEVSAPGVSIRSSIENGEYDFFSGTSMASPHVSGAVLLLREAYPDVPGEEILLALYNSATDLGEEGEDNTYGMGFINVKDAYDLLAETYTPTPPATLSVDLDLVRIVSPSDDIICTDGTSAISPMIEVRNTGTEPVSNFNMFATIVGEGVEIPIEVLATIDPGVTQELNISPIPYSGTGFKELHLRIVPLDGEYDVLNNHAVYRWTEIPKYDWDSESSFQEDFSEGIDEEVWTVYNPDASITWDTLPVLQIDGTIGFAAHMSHPDYTAIQSQDDHLISPLILNRPAEASDMAFDYFYRKRSNNDFTQDTLVVFISRSCEDEYMSEELFRLGGEDLWTNDDSETDALPESTGEWQTVYLDMEFENENPFFFSFVTLNRRGNNILVDNIRMGNNLNTSDGLSDIGAKLFPNPSNGTFTIKWDLTEKANVAVYEVSGRLIKQLRNIENGETIGDLGISQGVYLVEIAVGDAKSTQKLVIN